MGLGRWLSLHVSLRVWVSSPASMQTAGHSGAHLQPGLWRVDRRIRDAHWTAIGESNSFKLRERLSLKKKS